MYDKQPKTLVELVFPVVWSGMSPTRRRVARAPLPLRNEDLTGRIKTSWTFSKTSSVREKPVSHMLCYIDIALLPIVLANVHAPDL